MPSPGESQLHRRGPSASEGASGQSQQITGDQGPLPESGSGPFTLRRRSMAKSQTFKATLERGMDPLGWTVIRVPHTVISALQIRGRFRVKGEISRQGGKGFAFRTSHTYRRFFPSREQAHA